MATSPLRNTTHTTGKASLPLLTITMSLNDSVPSQDPTSAAPTLESVPVVESNVQECPEPPPPVIYHNEYYWDSVTFKVNLPSEPIANRYPSKLIRNGLAWVLARSKIRSSECPNIHSSMARKPLRNSFVCRSTVTRLARRERTWRSLNLRLAYTSL